MWLKFLDNIQRYLFFWVIGAITLGLLQVLYFGGYPFSPLICLLAALVMIYPSLVPLSFGNLKQAVKKYNIIIISVFLNFVLAPLLAVLIGYIFLQNYPILWLGLILLSLLPGGGMVTTWALKSRANMSTTVGIIFFNFLAAILIAPFVLSFAFNKLGTNVLSYSKEEACGLSEASSGVVSCGLGGDGVTPIKIALPVFFIVVVPLALAYFTQKTIKAKKGSEYFEKNKRFFGEFSNLGLIVVLFILMSLENNSILFSEPQLIFKSLIALVLFYFMTLVMPLFLYKKFFNNSDGKALIWGSYLRYITLALGLGISLIYGNNNLSGMVIIIVLSYFIQIPVSFWLTNYLKNN
jgi:arsenite transporter